MKMVIKNGNVVTPEGVLKGFDIVFDGERIESIRPAGFLQDSIQSIDATGAWVLPGLIDIHADFIENMIAPRPTSVMNMELAFREAERVLATHGITTMFHSISFISDLHAFSMPIRAPEMTRSLLNLISGSHDSPHLIHHRFHARFEIDSHDRVEELKGYIAEKKVHLLSIMDHTPGQGQYRDMGVYRATMKAWKKLDENAVDKLVSDIVNRPMMEYKDIVELTQVARSHGVSIASHDDDTFAKLDLVEEFGALISEFPTTIEVAREARRRGMHTVAGAPNVLLGGSHSGNLSAAEAVSNNAVDILCSDYYPAGLLHSVFQLHHLLRKPLHEMVNLVTLNPARAVRIHDDTGSIEPGKLADLIIVRDRSDGGMPFPAVSEVFVSGKNVMSSRYRSA